MNLNASKLITAVSIVVALASVSFAIKASKQRKLAIAETEALQQQLAEQKERVQRRRAPEQDRTARETPGNTNALAALNASPEVPEAAADGEEPKQERPKRESFEDRMARMKAEDPEGYAEMIQQRQERQQEMRYNLAERTATFMDLDTSTMTEEERASHEQLVEKMASIWELSALFQDPEQAPDRETMGKLFNEMREVRPLMAQERTIMFKQLGADLGYTGDDSEVFARHVQDILEATSLNMPSSGRGGPGGGRGWSGGGRGGDGGGRGSDGGR